MSDVDIRAARPTDLTRVRHLASAFYIEDGFATPVSELRDNLVVLLHTGTARVAVASGQHDIVGFAITTLGIGLEQGTVAELNGLFVEPAHRRTGVAAALIDDSADWVRSRTLELVIAPTAQMSPTSSATTPIKTSPTSAWSNVSPDGGGIRSALPCGRWCRWRRVAEAPYR